MVYNTMTSKKEIATVIKVVEVEEEVSLVTVTMTEREAQVLRHFVGATGRGLVEEVLRNRYSTTALITEINDTLYSLYNAFLDGDVDLPPEVYDNLKS